MKNLEIRFARKPRPAQRVFHAHCLHEHLLLKLVRTSHDQSARPSHKLVHDLTKVGQLAYRSPRFWSEVSNFKTEAYAAMEGVWADDYEEDEDFLDYLGEAEEVPEPGQKRAKTIDPNDPDQPKEPKKPRIVQNPRPKLDVDRLMSDERGLPELLRMASDITFKPGDGIKNMKRTLALLELWSHRLFPKYTFDDILMKCEVLGKKRPIKTHLKKVRIGLVPM